MPDCQKYLLQIQALTQRDRRSTDVVEWLLLLVDWDNAGCPVDGLIPASCFPDCTDTHNVPDCASCVADAVTQYIAEGG